MKALIVALFLCFEYSAWSQVSQLSPSEVQAAIEAKPNAGFVDLINMSLFTPSECRAQMPEEDIFTPTGWLHALSINSRKQYRDFNPSDEDKGRYLTVISKGCASGSISGPVCDTITRVVILSDKDGTDKAEAIKERPLSQSWQNGFGASATCSGLVSKFDLSEVQKIVAMHQELFIATFSGSRLLKVYRVKKRDIKQLGL